MNMFPSLLFTIYHLYSGSLQVRWKGILVFQGRPTTFRMVDPPKTISDTSRGELKAANNVIGLIRVVPSHKEYNQSCGSADQLGSTTRVATAAEAGERSARKYDSNCFACMSGLNALPPAKCTSTGFLSSKKVGWVLFHTSV
jgi:hypothetical protein